MKLRTKLTLITTIIVILSIIASTLLAVLFAKQSAINQITLQGLADFEEFSRSFISSAGYTSPDLEEIPSYSYLRYQFYKIPNHTEYVLQQGDDIISNNTGIDAVGALEASHSLQTTNFSPSDVFRHAIFSTKGQSYFIASADMIIEREEYTLSLVRDVTTAMDDVNRLALYCTLAGVAIILVAALLVFLLIRRSLRPVQELEQGAIQISDGNYESRIDIEGKDEIASLAERFNKMADAVSGTVDSLNETAERQQMFIHALSHEMKTPVTSIMARAETLLLRDVSEKDKKHSLERIYNQCAWLEKLSGTLTTLVLLQESIDVEPRSIRELFAAVQESTEDMLDERNSTLIMDCGMDRLTINFELMRAALVNLVDNARKASEKGSIIKISAYDHVIEVTDHGRGIAPEKIKNITQPFYVADSSRNKKMGGSGLGLALVEKIAQAHNAKLCITSTPGKGTTVRIVFSPENIDK